MTTWNPGDQAIATVRGVADVAVVRTDDPDLPWHSDERVPDYFGPQTEHAERMVLDVRPVTGYEQVSDITSSTALRLAACPTCNGRTRETVNMVCQTCGTNYGGAPRDEPPEYDWDQVMEWRGWR